MNNAYQALYRLRSDNDWDLMLILGLDATPAENIFELAEDYFGENETFMVVESDKNSFPDVYDGNQSSLKLDMGVDGCFVKIKLQNA